MNPSHLPPCLLLAATGCLGHVGIEFSSPAAFELPSSIERLTPVDRAQAFLSAEVVGDLGDRLESSGRYEVTDRQAAQGVLAEHQLDANRPLPTEVSKAICAATGADGLIVLESLQADPQWTEATKQVEHTRTEEYDVGDERKTREVREEYELATAGFNLSYDAFWSAYDCQGRVLVASDATVKLSATGDGLDHAEARAAVGDQGALHFQAARQVAHDIAEFIAPNTAAFTRRFYKSGSAGIRSGVASMSGGDWEAATTQWQLAAEQAEGAVRGKALLNLAVAAERRGELDQALQLARQAQFLLDNCTSRSHVVALEARVEGD